MRAFLILILLFGDPAHAAQDEASVINVAIQDTNVKASLENWQMLSDHLMKDHQLKVILHIENDPEKLEVLVKDQKIDMSIDTLLPLLAIDGGNQLEPSFVAWKAGVKAYDGCLVARQDQNWTVGDLKGKVVGFEDPLSTASFALPFSTMIREGIALEHVQMRVLAQLKKKGQLKSEKEALLTMPRSPQMVHYLFTKSDETSVHWLHRGFLDAAGMSCRTASKQKDLRVIAQSPKVPRALVSLRKSLNPDLKQRLTLALENLGEGHPALEKIGKITHLTRLSEEESASLSELTPILLRLLKKTRDDQKNDNKGGQ